jgi:hypothetical protein
VLNDVLMLNALIAINIKLVFNVFLIVINLNDALDVEHTNQYVFEKPDFDFLNDDE